MKMLLEIAPIVVLVFWIYWYYCITKKIAPKIWGFIHIVYHLLFFYSLTLSDKIMDVAVKVYLLVPIVFGFFWGIDKIAKTNYSVNLYDWFGGGSKVMRSESVDDGSKGNSNVGNAIALVLVGITFFILLLYFM